MTEPLNELATGGKTRRAQAAASDAPRRTDPRSFLVRALALGSQLVLPILFGGYAILDKGELADLIAYFVPLVIAVVGANLLIAYLRWSRLTYAVGAEDIRVESGVLSRAARSVPYERIQDVSLEQKPIPRLFGLVEVRFETGAGGGDDIKLAYLVAREGERLRELVRARRAGGESGVGSGGGSEIAAGGDAAQGQAPAQTLFAMSPGRVATFGLFEFSLAVVAAVLGAVQQFDFLLPFDPWDLAGWQDRVAGSGHWLAGLGIVAQAAGAVLAIAALLVIGTVTGLARTVLREWDFRLERSAKGLRRRRGLLTRTDLVMPADRIQALRIGTGIVRRLFGWHSLKVVSLASDSGSANHDAVPFARMAEIAPVVRETGFALPPADLAWHRPSARAHRDAAGAIALLFGAATLAAALVAPLWWTALVPLAAGATLVLRESFLWRFDRHALDSHQLYARHGWLAPSMAIGSREKLQSVELVQGPIARLRGYADLRFGLAGGRLRMRRMPLARAREMRDAVLASMAMRDFSATMEAGPGAGAGAPPG